MLNSMGWYDNGGVFHDPTYSAPELSESLKLYSRLQYNAMYDNKGRLPDLFEIKARLPKD